MDSITILIVDDHPVVLRGIRALLSASFSDACIVEASGAEEAEAVLSRRNIDIMITDLDLNGASGLALIRHVRQVMPAAQVVIYTMHEEAWTVGEMADADYGYVGAGPGKISLYKQKMCVEKAIPESEAVEHLLRFIEEDRKKH